MVMRIGLLNASKRFELFQHCLNSSVIIVDLLDKGKNCKRLLQRHVIFYEETFSSKIKNIDSSFSKLVYSFHSTYQEREIEPSMKREKSYDYRRVKDCAYDS